MYLSAGGQKTSAEVKAVGTAATFVPVVGPILGPTIAAIGSIIPMLSGKAHYSPWNFLYDDYPQHIWENEHAIVQLKNAINAIALPGSPQIPDPPMWQKTGGPQYQASMQAIVPRYVPGSESKIANYDRTLNESGGAYEVTVGNQLALIPQLQAQLQQVQAQAKQVQAAPIPMSATAPPLSTPQPVTAQAPAMQVYAPPQAQPINYTTPAPQVIYQPSAAPTVQQPIYQPAAAPNITVTTPGAIAAQSTDLSQYMPFLIGGAALIAVLAFMGKKKGH